MIRPGQVGLGFRRLSIIDLEGGNQPLPNETKTVHVTCNGEIYNFRALRQELRARGHSFASKSDSEVIAHLYEEHGVDFVERLQGMFAIALWDDREQRLILARDRLGVKPIYWARLPDGLLYASEPAAIHASELLPARPDLAALKRYLTLQYVPPPASGFEGVHKLAPGERLIFERGRERIERYWQLDYTDRRISWEEALDELDCLLRRATRERLVADVPLGAFLSGGVDSSLVVSYMAEAQADVRTFSIDFEEDAYSEGEHAQRVASTFGTNHRSAVLEPDIVDLVDTAVRHAGEPFADSSAIPTLLLSGFTRRDVTVALSGDGGDEAFGGYRRYALAVASERIRPAGPGARILKRTGADKLPLLRGSQAGRAIDVLARSPAERYAKLMSHFEPAELGSLCTREFMEGAGKSNTWTSVLAPRRDLGRVDRYLALDTETYLPGDLLLKVDRMSMAHALEVRSPLLDYRVFEFAASLPGSQKLRLGQTKRLLKELARRRGVPASVVDRPKQGFGVPVAAWMRGPLKGWMEDLLLDATARDRGWLRPAGVEALVAEHLHGKADHSARLWNLAMLESWQRHSCDG